jgi:hypothetical protein
MNSSNSSKRRNFRSGLLSDRKVSASALFVLVTLFGIVSLMGVAASATLTLDTNWPGLFDTRYGFPIGPGWPPNCAPSAEPTIVVGATALHIAANFSYGVFQENGQYLFQEELSAFFGNGLIPSHNWGVSEPQLLYDQFGDPSGNGRFITVAAARDPTTQQSWIVVGATSIYDTTASDCTFEFDANFQPGAPSTNYWPNNPRVGMSADSVVIVADMNAFSDNSFQYTKLWVLPKTGLYDRPYQCPLRSPTPSFITSGLQWPNGSTAHQVVPAKSYDTNSSITYLASAFTGNGNELSLWTLDTQQLTLLPGLIGAAVPVQAYVQPPPAAQRGTTTTITHWTRG